MKMELTDEKRKGYVVCALMILVSCLYLVYLGYSLYRMGAEIITDMRGAVRRGL